MSKEVALSLAASHAKQGAVSYGMTLANEYYKSMHPDSWDTVFKQSDIQLCKFYEEAQLTQRERDLIYVASFLHPCYTDLHTTVLTLGELLSPASADSLDRLFNILKQYNLTNILLNGRITDAQFIKIMVELK